MTAVVARRRAERWGRWAELMCVVRLRLSGWRILSRRHAGLRGTGIGEIDIIARRGRVLAFIEVKARPTREAGLEAISSHQQQRIIRAAHSFLARHGDLGVLDARFDIMIVGPGWIPYHLADAWRPS